MAKNKVKDKLELVSVIIPMYNEEKYINGLIDSLIRQDYAIDKYEIIFVDGNSKDRTVNIIKSRLDKKKYDYKILNNKKKITPVALNIGIKNAKNDIIIRLDAHSEYPSNYISKCVYYLNNVDADNVGCILEAQNSGRMGEAISNVLSSKFGVGNSKFRTNSKSGYVDTVPFGTFRRELFDKIGYFNENLPRNQDSEFNSRIIKNGGKIYIFNDIKITYHPRDTIIKLSKMAIMNGKWNLYTNYLVPGSMKIRHFVPFIFVITLLLGIIGCILNIGFIKILFFVELAIYILLDIIYSFKSVKSRGLIVSILSLIIYPIFHITYGFGTFLGIFMIFANKRRRSLK